MKDEIKEILSKMERLIVYGQYNAYYNLEKQILDYITNLQEAFEKSYTEEQLDFAVNEVKEQVKAEHQLNNQLHNEIDKLRVKNYELQEENERLREDLKYTVPQVEHNQIVTKLCKEKQNYKSICEKIKEYLEKHILFMREGSVMALLEIDEIFNIFQGSDKE